ncbi:MAG TPA: nicotinamide-nucleotide amidohydrolase family protein, partial [Dehalococcoidia bacterium]|nr:nicotinamide-nucleotide amidohydrolase family protein [Dehalococcoidia bacterium]
LIARASKHEEAKGIIAQSEAQLREILADNIWGFDSNTLEGAVGALLAEKGLTLATMESFTGGFLANTLTDALKSSAYYKGGIIAYSNEAKITLGVDAQLIAQFGAISAEVAEAMAIAARKLLIVNIGVGITGVAGPDKIEGKAPGSVYIAICDDRGKWIRNWNFPPHFQLKHRTAVATLFGLRQRLLSLD